MKRERLIKTGVLSAVFIIAMIGFSHLTNRGSTNMTADMGSPTLPTISFEMNKQEVNMLVGYKNDVPAIVSRDAILSFDEDGVLKAKIQSYGNQILALNYAIYTLDAEEKLLEESIQDVGETVKLKVNKVLQRNQEGLLKIALKLEDEEVYYYTRIVRDNKFYTDECLAYAEEFHDNALKKEHEDTIKKVLETDATSKNNSLQHVNIHSDLNHVLWGDLKPKQLGEARITITETKKAYTSVVLRYQVMCQGDNNKEEIYNVKEFFKILYKNEKCYLLEYDRTMEEVFDTSNVVLSSKGIVLGIADENLEYQVSEDGARVAFVQAGELWSYNKEKNKISLLFSFAEAEEEDVRNTTDKHSIQIHNVDTEGNVLFSVCGYMNRGAQEGKIGAAIFYYDANENVIDERCFIQSNSLYPVIEKELTEFVYYNKKNAELYLVAQGKLVMLNSKSQEPTVLLENVNKKGFVSSDDGRVIAYYKVIDDQRSIESLDLETGSKWEISPEEGEILITLGFVGNDIVYGISSEELAGQDVSGNQIQAMRRLEIRDQNQKVVKTYEKSDCDILGVTIEDNIIRLRQGRRNGTTYVEVEEDHITNNEAASGEITLKSYWTDLKQTQYRLLFSEGIKSKKTKTLKPKFVLRERDLVLKSDAEKSENCYYVYGHGTLAGVFSETKNAVALAESISGVVVSAKQNCVWEADNRVAWYRNFSVERFTANEGENALTACVRKILAVEKKTMEDGLNLDVLSAEQMLGSQLEAEVIRFQGNSVRDVFYLMNRDIPIIAMKGSTSAILLVGYDAQTVTYVDPISGASHTQAIEKVDELLKGSGNLLIAYMK